MTKQCVLNCDISEAFFKFPVDFDLCMKWIQKTGDPDLWNDFEYGGAAAFINKYLCSNHFVDADYLDFENKHLGLKEEAAPVLYHIKSERLDDAKEHSLDVSKRKYFQSLDTIRNDEGSTDNSLDSFMSVKSEPLEIEVEPQITELSFMEYDSKIVDLLKQSPVSFLKDESPGSASDQKSTTSKAAYMAARRRLETPEKRAERLEKDRIRTARKRQIESEEESMMRRMRCAERTSARRARETEEQRKIRLERLRIQAREKRKNMTPEQKAAWRERNKIQTRERRQREDEVKKMVRRYNEAVRVSIKRSEETEEQKMERRYREAKRAAERRRNQTAEEREERLRKDRERIQARRARMKIDAPKEMSDQEKDQIMSILNIVHQHMERNFGSISGKRDNVADLKQAVRDSHPQLSSEVINQNIRDILDESNQSECSSKTDNVGSGGFGESTESFHVELDPAQFIDPMGVKLEPGDVSTYC